MAISPSVIRRNIPSLRPVVIIYSLSQITAQDYQQILSPLRRGNKQKTKIQIIFYIDALDEILNYGPILIARKYKKHIKKGQPHNMADLKLTAAPD